MPDDSRIPEARAAAVDVLSSCIDQARPLFNLPAHRSVSGLSDPDRAFAAEIIYGTLRNLLRVDFLVDAHSAIKPERMDYRIRWILRISLYQLEFMSVPDYAVVDDAVRLSRHFGKSSASGFVNAVLRDFLRNRHPLPSGNSVSTLSIRYSHPKWLVKRYISRHGVKAAKKIMRRNNVVPDSYVRINNNRIETTDFCRRLETEGLTYQLFPELEGCLRIDQRGFDRHQLYREGFCFYMDYGSQMVASRVGVEPGMRIGDFCAAPGGKSFILAEQALPGGFVLSADISSRRLRQMQLRLKHYEISNCALVRADMEKSAPPAMDLDRILLDVPCSGLGTIRSNPDIRWLFREENLEKNQGRQLKILENGFKALAKGQLLFYTSCSSEPEENEQVINEFLRREPSAVLRGEPLYTLVDQEEGEGFFLAALKKL